MLDALASIAPSCMFFAIGEQLNALTGLLLCLYMTPGIIWRIPSATALFS